MNEEAVVSWENILTILIGIVIIASIYLIVARRKSAKRKSMEREEKLLRKRNEIDNEIKPRLKKTLILKKK